MWLHDLINYFLDAQSYVGPSTYVCGYANDYCWDCVEEYGNCPGTAFTAVAAAFATQGMWVQSDLLDMLTFSNMAALGPLIYVCAAIGGLIGVAINQPPRVYMWFFLGPAIYGWLIDARQEVNGVQWQVGMRQQDQREVWKLSEVGLLNTNMAKRLEDWGSGHGVSGAFAPSSVGAANFFVWYDSTLSGVINGLIDWAGPYAMSDNPFSIDSNVGAGGEYVNQDGEESFRNDRWFLLSNLKWSMIQDVTNAKVTSASLRDAFSTFVGGLCGEEMYGVVDEAAFVSAAHGSGENIPATVFKRSPGAGDSGPNDMAEVLRALNNTSNKVSLPDGLSYKGLFRDKISTGSFFDAIGGENWTTESPWASFAGVFGAPKEDYIRCDQYLALLILAFRWEASHIYHQMVLKAPEITADRTDDFEEQEKKFLYNLFYGWNLKRDRDNLYSGITERTDPFTGNLLSWGEKRQFLIHLILMHLIRNEFAIVKQPVDVRRLGSELAVNYAEGQMRTVGSISKFGEVYSWAILMPYLQGVLMYFLAVAYPFACLFMIMPGMHKSLFTWMSFWAWVKLWDVGFALVMALERSVWAMVGNSNKAAGIFDKVIDVGEFGSTVIGACQGSTTGCSVRPVLLSSDPVGFIGAPLMQLNDWDVAQNLRIFDRALALGPSLDLDLSNSYYIYIMAALYLAVPAVTGQLVLGAKAGMASLMTQAIGQNAQEAGRASGSAYTGDITQRLKSNASSIGQAAYAAYMQKTNLASDAIQTANKQALSSIEASKLGAWKEAVGYRPEMQQQTASQYGQHGNVMKGMWNTAGAVFAQGMGGVWSPFSSGMSYKTDKFTAAKSVDAIQASKEALAQKGQYNADAFKAGAEATAFGRASGLSAQKAQFGAEMARWSAINQMANQLGGISSAVGVAPGALDPGPKPMSMDGMAMSGMLGKSAKDKADTFDPFRTGGILGGLGYGGEHGALSGMVPEVTEMPKDPYEAVGKETLPRPNDFNAAMGQAGTAFNDWMGYMKSDLHGMESLPGFAGSAARTFSSGFNDVMSAGGDPSSTPPEQQPSSTAPVAPPTSVSNDPKF